MGEPKGGRKREDIVNDDRRRARVECEYAEGKTGMGQEVLSMRWYSSWCYATGAMRGLMNEPLMPSEFFVTEFL
jgi:hypothetical protein